MATPTPYIERHDGDLIQAEEWNAIQIQARTELQSHDHSGGEQGTNIRVAKSAGGGAVECVNNAKEHVHMRCSG
jgi:hypothetical protein